MDVFAWLSYPWPWMSGGAFVSWRQRHVVGAGAGLTEERVLQTEQGVFSIGRHVGSIAFAVLVLVVMFREGEMFGGAVLIMPLKFLLHNVDIGANIPFGGSLQGFLLLLAITSVLSSCFQSTVTHMKRMECFDFFQMDLQRTSLGRFSRIPPLYTSYTSIAEFTKTSFRPRPF